MEKKEPEKYFAKAVEEYFGFHKRNFRDEDGYALAPDWSGMNKGMEFRSLKLLLETLRKIAEGKQVEWTEERMISDLNNFMSKAINHNLLKKDFRVSLLNRFKIEILSSNYNPQLSKKILEVWYHVMPEYTRDYERDREAGEIVVKFLKEQYVLASVEFSENSMMQSARTIFANVKTDPFWETKPLKSIVKNLQEFVNRVKQNKNGQRVNTKTDGINNAFDQAFGRNKTS